MAVNFEWHFYHGFLGEPCDWQEVVNQLEIQGLKSENVVLHNLEAECAELNSVSFSDWAQYQNNYLESRNLQKILVGYSMGGRLLMHLKPSLFSKAFLIGSHPGLSQGRDRRQDRDRYWAELLENGKANEWLETWNNQTSANY